jgi:hypothetical protein
MVVDPSVVELVESRSKETGRSSKSGDSEEPVMQGLATM